MCQRCENAGSYTACPAHTTANYGDESDVFFHIHAVRLNSLDDLCADLFLDALEVFGVHDNGHGVDAGGHVFQRNLVVCQYAQHVTAETDLAVHEILVDVDGGELFLAGNTGDGVSADLLVGAVRYDHRARLFRRIGVADVDGDACGTNREDGCFMEHRCAHVGQLTQFGVGDGADDCRIFHNAGVCH